MSKRKGIFGDLFDYNGDGEMSIAELAADYNYFKKTLDNDKKPSDYDSYASHSDFSEDSEFYFDYNTYSDAEKDGTSQYVNVENEFYDDSEDDIDTQIEDAMIDQDKDKLEYLVRIKYDGLTLVEALMEDSLLAYDYELWFDDDIRTLVNAEILDIDEGIDRAISDDNKCLAEELIMEKYNADSLEEAFYYDSELAEEYYSKFSEEKEKREIYYNELLKDAWESGDNDEFDRIIEEKYFGKTVDDLLEEDEEFSQWYEEKFDLYQYPEEDEVIFSKTPVSEKYADEQNDEEENKQNIVIERKLIKDKDYIIKKVYNDYQDDYYVISAGYLCHSARHKELETVKTVLEQLYDEKRISENGLYNITKYFIETILDIEDREYLWSLRFNIIPVIKQSGIRLLENDAEIWQKAFTDQIENLDYAKKNRKLRLEKEEAEKYEWRKKYKIKYGVNPNDFEKEYQYQLAFNKADYERRKGIQEKYCKTSKTPDDGAVYTYYEVYIKDLNITLSYRAEDDSIVENDDVEVDVRGKKYIGCVKSKEMYKSSEVPFPVSRTKFIIRKISSEHV